ncbi:unnamed protein product (macronuclear) [Paramecium tetraurelia]|uniref:Uncharacterized protein n=1 Tax=Paramecium tetraurelia TaxID=5888 RepID=A0D1Q1_PARTE|nr:uncharacterized protein GSPATT00012492001 [Paramecium tetraurelia]CAK76968.1 unnamed protein product [Paramecium tetraurelia]|eukprot:XP_001444365.1 hypothetical protein (macronuclear) [Paramecium tetraurelia strain d4-2]
MNLVQQIKSNFGMIQRKEIIAKNKKKVEIQNQPQLIFSIKRRHNDQAFDNIFFSNEEEMLNFLYSRKQKRLNLDELVGNLSLNEKNQQIVGLQRIPLQNIDSDQNQEFKETAEKSLIYFKRDRFVTKFRKDFRDSLLSNNRKKIIIQLEQNKNCLTSVNEKANYEFDEDYYIIQKVEKEKAKSQITMKIDTKQIEKQIAEQQYGSDAEESFDSEDSQRTDYDDYDSLDEESSQQEAMEEEEQYSDNNSDDSVDLRRFQSNQVQQDDFEVDDKEDGNQGDQTEMFTNFIKQHEKLIKDKVY